MANTLRFKRGLVSTIPTALAGEPLFTTDTFDLYIGNGTTNTRFQKYIASGTTSQLLRGDGSLLTMPIVLTSPSTGQVLKYNGTNWVNDSDAGITGSGAAGQVAFFTGATTQGGSNNLFWDATNNRLGIGTNAPAHRLDVNGNIRIPNSGFIYINSSTGTAIGALSIDAGDNTIINTATAGDIYLRSAGSTIARLLSTGDVNIGGLSATTTPIVKITSTGRLGVNNTAPTYTTDITGTLRSTTTTYLATSSGNVLVGSTTDNGLRFQVTGDGYFSGSVGIGTSTFSGYNLVIGKNISGGASIYSVSQSGTVQTDVTTNAGGFINFLNTAASTNVTSYYHYRALQNTIGASTTLGNQFGYHVADLTTAVYNYAFYGNVSSGSNKWNLYMNGSAANYLNGNLGVGITTPTARVEAVGVSGTTLIRATGADSNGNADVEIRSTGTTGASRLFFGDTAATSGSIIYNHSNDSMQLATVATIRATLDASGNLGLGVTPSAWRSNEKVLQLGTYTALWNIAFVTALGNNTYTNSSGTPIYLNTDLASRYLQQNGKHVWETAPSGTAGNAITFTQAMTLDASGNLGLGTTAPAVKFEIAGTGTQQVRITSTSGADMRINADTVGRVGTYSNSNLAIVTNGVAIGTFFTTGNLSLNSVVDAGFRLDVNGTMRVSGASTFSSTITSSNYILATAPSSSYAYYLYGRSSDNYGAIWFGSNNGATRYGYIQSGSPYGGTLAIVGDGGARIDLDNRGITASGAATFSSSVTAGGLVSAATEFRLNTNAFQRIAKTDASGGYAGGYNLDYSSSGVVTHALIGAIAGMRYETGGNTLFFNNTSQAAGTTATERMRITSGGNLLVNTTSDAGYRLRVNGTSYFDDNLRFPNAKGVVFVQTGGSLLGSISMDAANQVTLDNNGFAGLSVGGSYTMTGGNLGIGQGGAAFGSGTRVISVLNGTAPTSSVATSFLMYSANVTTGNAAPHFRTENGAVIKLYQETTAVGNAIISLGGGNAVLDDTTFDGYTLRQIVRALRNQGILQ